MQPNEVVQTPVLRSDYLDLNLGSITSKLRDLGYVRLYTLVFSLSVLEGDGKDGMNQFM